MATCDERLKFIHMQLGISFTEKFYELSLRYVFRPY